MSNDKSRDSRDTLVVPVGDKAWNMAKDENMYVRPRSIQKFDFDYIAFYRKAPVSAITHVADVDEVLKKDSPDISASDQLVLLGDVGVEVDVVQFSDLREIDNVPWKNLAIQRYWLVDYDDLEAATDLRDLKEKMN